MKNRELHPVHWIWIWPLALPIFFFLGVMFAGEWLGKKKRKFMGPSKDWRPWFAWHPVELGNGQAIWLEWVERRADGYSENWVVYRANEPGSPS